MKQFRLSPCLTAILVAHLPWQAAQAVTGTWSGAGGATWDTTAANWTGVTGTPWDATNGPNNTAWFNVAATPVVSGTVYVNTITMDAATTISGGTITLAGSSPTINGTGTGVIYSVLAGTNGLTKSGAGTVSLDPGNGFAANTFSGDITINGGNLVSIRSTSLGDGAGAITINSGGILNVDWSTVTRTGLVTVNGGTLRTQGGSPQLINNGAGFVFQNGAAITTSLGGSGGLTVNGARSYLYSANTYTGATVISNGGDLALLFGGTLPTNTAVDLSGTLLANNKSHTVGGLTGASTGLLYGDTAYTFTVNKVSGTDSYGGTIQNIGTFIKDGAGTLSLTHANNNTLFPSALTVSNGVLELGGAGRFAGGSYGGAVSLSSASSVLRIATSANQTLSGTISGSGSLAKSGTGTLTLSGSNSYSGGTTVNGGNLTASHVNALGDAAGAVTVNSGGVLHVNANMTRTGTVTVNGGELGSSNGSTLTNNGGGFVLTGSSAAAALVLAGSSGLTVSSPDARLWTQATYSGATTVNSGQLNICGSGGIPTTSAISIASGATVNLTSFFAPTNINRTIAGLSGAGVLYGGGGTVTINMTSGTDTFTGDIQGAQGLIKTGAGTLALGGSSSYTGTTEVNAGILVVAHGNALGSTSAGTTVASGAQLRLNGVTVGAEPLTISGTGAGASAGALRAGSGSNTYQGKVTLTADAKIFAGSGTSMTLDVASGDAVDLDTRTLTFEGAGTHAVNDGITGTGGVTKIGSGILTLAGTSNYTGATTVSDGTLLVNGSTAAASAIGVSGATLGGNGTVGGATTFTGASIHAPGSAAATVGTQTFSSTLAYGSGTIFNWDIDVTDPNTSTYDKVTAAGAITGGAAVFKIVLAAGDSFGDAFWNTTRTWTDIFGGAGAPGNLAAIFSGFDASGSTDALGVVTGQGQFTISNVSNTLTWTAIPEPTSALAGLLLTVGLLRRRRA